MPYLTTSSPSAHSGSFWQESQTRLAQLYPWGHLQSVSSISAHGLLPHRRSPSLPSHAAPHSCHSTEETQRQAEGYCCFPAGHRGLEATGHPFWARSPTTGFRSPALENSKTTRPGLHRKGYGVLPFYRKRGAISSPLKSERVVGGF